MFYGSFPKPSAGVELVTAGTLWSEMKERPQGTALRWNMTRWLGLLN